MKKNYYRWLPLGQEQLRQVSRLGKNGDRLMNYIYKSDDMVVIHNDCFEIRFPAHPKDCDWIEVNMVDDNLEKIAGTRWIADEWVEDPVGTMGAIMGAFVGVLRGTENDQNAMMKAMGVL